MLGTTEIIIVLVVAGLILFDKKNRIGEIARALGKFSSEFKKGKKEAEKEIEEIKKELKFRS